MSKTGPSSACIAGLAASGASVTRGSEPAGMSSSYFAAVSTGIDASAIDQHTQNSRSRRSPARRHRPEPVRVLIVRPPHRAPSSG
ncbi:MAG: hypothetical protein LKI24_01880 [Acidipropionibacterium sp.]|nr:hypothetical protein [Acidipropionibacterium sp.]